jgi:ATP-dependent helicase HrpB
MISSLPIDSLLPEVVGALEHASALVLEAPPGAGKTTRVPRAILDAAGSLKEIWVLQPRRLATRLAARRVAQEMGEPLGRTVGYQVRFEDVGSERTRLRFITEGILGRRLISDPTLRKVGAVVLDEFHERSLAGDLSLALLRRLQLGERPDLKLIVMSATLQAEPIAAYLGHCPILRSAGRAFEVAVEHLPAPDPRPLEELVHAALKKLAVRGGGDVLVFLPGAAEIRRTASACADLASRHGMIIRPLHGDLPPEDQDLAVQPSSAQKLILATNVAETSVTIEGVTCVIDSGLARVASHSPWSGLPVLKVAKISRASAIQRAGRAGRTQPGRCWRLYTSQDLETRPEHEVPEIRRADLTEAVLSLRASGVADPGSFPFFEIPPTASIQAADQLLRRLGAVDPNGRLTELGRRLLEFPVHPRQARVILEAEKRGVGSEGALLAAILGERDIRQEARTEVKQRGQRSRSGPMALSGPSDLLDIAERYREAERRGFTSEALRLHGLQPGGTRAVERAHRQLSRLVRASAPRPQGAEAAEQGLMISILAGYPDRVGRRRGPNSRELQLVGGGTATLAESSVVHQPALLVAMDAEERAGARAQGILVRMASQVELEWLLEVAPGDLREVDQLEWNAQLGRVERVRRVTYADLMLEENRAVAPPSEESNRILCEAAWAAGPAAFVDPEELGQWKARIELLARHFPEAGLQGRSDEILCSALEQLTIGKQSLAQLQHPALLNAALAQFTPEQSRLWRTMTPERVELPAGRQLKVHYEPGKPPWVQSRLQDFFGMARGPSVCGGRAPVVLHLLAPNQRAVQVTEDLAGFWSRHYPAIRRELARKYPRHAWPEDPLRASPPSPRSRPR